MCIFKSKDDIRHEYFKKLDKGCKETYGFGLIELWAFLTNHPEENKILEEKIKKAPDYEPIPD